ncbi:MAG: DNA replication and repair protein RecF [Bdellovibrionaceae bacterium]|nr:DNA replication and repair protein RecF [Pseudobdellovibrionaceae bacterium]
MRISNLKLKNFRNYRSLEADLDFAFVAFVGNNGQGKTNLLEAINIAATGSSFRYGNNSDFILNSSDGPARIELSFQKEQLDYKVQCEIDSNKKHFFLNTKKATAGDVSKLIPLTLFCPESLAAIKESGEHRRKLVDDALFILDKGYYDDLSRFSRTLKARNKILKDLLEGRIGITSANDLLDSIDPSYLESSFLVADKRIKLLRKIVPDLSNLMAEIFFEDAVDISVEYLVSGENLLNTDSNNLRYLIEKRLREMRGAEIAAGRSLVGPQKHDIKFLYNGNDSRFFCSQGQQRSLILAFKLAQIVYHGRAYGSYPILMLDDVLSELDLGRRGKFLSILRGLETQILITTTEIHSSSILKDLQLKVFNVSKGTLN